MNRGSFFKAIGLMSGTSLDGLDIAYCEFEYTSQWHFQLRHAETIDYEVSWRNRLSEAHLLSGLELTRLNVELGELHGEWVRGFMAKHGVMPDFIASHGHTVFHQPQSGFTLQIGSPAHIVAAAGVDVVADFRTNDVALGGQGAPLVPVGDVFLFGRYPICLNLGGIANASVKKSLQIEAFDIGLCNMPLNFFAEQLGFAYDAAGAMSSAGMLSDSLLARLNALDFFQKPAPKSLGKEFWLSEFLPVVHEYKLSPKDTMRTITEHIAMQIGDALSEIPEGDMLITGGGAHNAFLMERIAAHSKHRIVVPERNIVDYKEALIFAFLGVLRMTEQPNALASVTGAQRDSISGAVYCAR